ncbi:MAG: hypothetical protein AAFY31_09095 [Pseudomonadota bacterium]
MGILANIKQAIEGRETDWRLLGSSGGGGSANMLNVVSFEADAGQLYLSNSDVSRLTLEFAGLGAGLGTPSISLPLGGSMSTADMPSGPLGQVYRMPRAPSRLRPSDFTGVGLEMTFSLTVGTGGKSVSYIFLGAPTALLATLLVATMAPPAIIWSSKAVGMMENTQIQGVSVGGGNAMVSMRLVGQTDLL